MARVRAGVSLVRASAASGKVPSGSLLVATDFSPPSRRAFDAATALAQDLGVGLVLVHAAGESRPAVPRRKQAREDRAAGDANELTAWAEAARAEGLRVATVTQPGKPADLILQAAKDNGCSMLVLAASGKGLVRTLLVGSTAREVLRRSRLPVLVLPHRASKPKEGEKAAGRTLVVGLDLSSEGEAAYQAAIRLAKDLKAVIRLVHVVEYPVPATALPYADAAMPAEFLDQLEQEGAAALVHQASKARAHKVGVVPVQHFGQATSALLADAKQAGASLIVVGSHGKSSGRQFFVGSVAQALAQMADRPVLIVPDPKAKSDAGAWTR